MTKAEKAEKNETKVACETEAKNKVETFFEEVEGCGVVVTKTLGNTVSTTFVPGAKVKEDKLVSILSA